MYVGTLTVISGSILAHFRYCEVNKLEDKTVQGVNKDVCGDAVLDSIKERL